MNDKQKEIATLLSAVEILKDKNRLCRLKKNIKTKDKVMRMHEMTSCELKSFVLMLAKRMNKKQYQILLLFLSIQDFYLLKKQSEKGGGVVSLRQLTPTLCLWIDKFIGLDNDDLAKEEIVIPQRLLEAIKVFKPMQRSFVDMDGLRAIIGKKESSKYKSRNIAYLEKRYGDCFNEEAGKYDTVLALRKYISFATKGRGKYKPRNHK